MFERKVYSSVRCEMVLNRIFLIQSCVKKMKRSEEKINK